MSLLSCDKSYKAIQSPPLRYPPNMCIQQASRASICRVRRGPNLRKLRLRCAVMWLPIHLIQAADEQL